MTIALRPAPAASTAVLLLAATTPALADVTAEDVWARWQSLSASFGQTLEAESETRSGDVLTVTDITVSMDMPDGGMTGTLDQLTFTENGDGTVTVTAAPSYPLTVRTTSADGLELVMQMEVLQPDLEIRVTGDADAQSYAFTAPRAELTTTDVTENGEPVDMRLSLAIEALDGVYAVGDATPAVIDSTLNAGALIFSLAADIPDDDADFEITFAMTDVASSSSGTLSPMATGQPNLSDLLSQGFYSAGTMTHGPATYSIDAMLPEGRAIVSGTAATGVIDGKIDESGISYGGGNTDVTMSVTVPGGMMPPLEIAIAETSGELTMPLTAGEDPQPIGLSMRLEDLTAGDVIWSMFDPLGALPRDPATLIVELSGMGRWFIDIADPEAIEEAEMDGAPGELDSLSLDALRLSLAGAELTGEGEVTFDNSGPAPVPAGSVDLELTGANALIGKLVSMGLIPEDQAMGAQMMLGLFARPVGEDQLTTTIEFKEDGSVLANGQRIR